MASRLWYKGTTDIPLLNLTYWMRRTVTLPCS